MEEQEQLAQGQENQGGKGRWIKVALPVFVLQVLVAYLLASSLIVPMLLDKATAGDTASAESREEEEESSDEFGAVYRLDDIIVNPAQSKGAQFVLINLAFEVKDEGEVKELERREVLLRDLVIKLVNRKTVDLLDDAEDKEVLRSEIMEEVKQAVPKVHLRNVYFANYIIQ